MNQKRKIIYLIISVSLLVNLAFAQSIQANFYLTDDKVFQGERTSAYLTISNGGINPINNIEITVADSALNLRNSITVPRLDAGSLYSRSFDIQTLKSTATGEHNLTATIEYEDKILILKDSLEIRPYPLEVKTSLENPTMAPNDINTLTVSVENVGDETASDFYVSIKTPSTFILNSSEKVALSRLEVGETFSKKFDFKARTTSSGDYHIIVHIFFVDVDGKEHMDELFVRVSVGAGLNFWETIAIVAILVLMVGFFIRKIS